MSDVKDLTSQMAKELALGIRDNVEDIAAAFRKMAIMNPNRKESYGSQAAERVCSPPRSVAPAVPGLWH